MKILVIQQKMIGDVLTSTIICETLRMQYPNAKIAYLVNSNTTPVIEQNPFFDHIIEFKNEYRKNKKLFFQFLMSIRASKYDLVIDAYGKLESNLITAFSKAPKKISYYKWYTQWIYTTSIHRQVAPITNASIAIENRLRLVLPEKEIANHILSPKIFLTDQEQQEAKTFLTQHGVSNESPLFMISVLGSSPNKTLPFSQMAAVIDEIVATTDANILFNYIPNQEKDAKKVYQLTTKKTQEKIHFTVFGKSLRQFIGILYHCDGLIGNEGGAVNMAKALQKPTFTIFSPWIIKEDWNMFEDGILHDSIHLIDIKPELYGQKLPSEMKKQSIALYREFSPELITHKLKLYLNNFNENLKPSNGNSGIR